MSSKYSPIPLAENNNHVYQSIMPVLVDRIEVALGPDWDWTSGLIPGSPRPTAVETAREGEELQRGYFATLLCIANNGLGPVLLTPGGPVLDHILTALLKVVGEGCQGWVFVNFCNWLHCFGDPNTRSLLIMHEHSLTHHAGCHKQFGQHGSKNVHPGRVPWFGDTALLQLALVKAPYQARHTQ